MAKTYVALVGLNYPDGRGGERRSEIGEPVTGLSDRAIAALLAEGAIEEAKAPAKATAEEAE